MSKTSIAWTDMTLNPIIGCTHAGYQGADGKKVAHPGCMNCYAEPMCSRKLPGFTGHNKCSSKGKWTGEIEVIHERLAWPFTRKEYQPRRDGRQRRCFLTSLSDMGHPGLAESDWMAVQGMMLLSPWIIWQDLTKRPEMQLGLLEKYGPRECVSRWMDAIEDNGVDCAAGRLGTEWLTSRSPFGGWSDFPHIHRYVSVSDQATADALIPELLRMPCAVRGVSLEPMVAAVDLEQYLPWRRWVEGQDPYDDDRCRWWSLNWAGPYPGCNPFRYVQIRNEGPTLDHVIIGGESGRGKGIRPFALEWALDIVQQCQRAGIPCFVKQMGSKPYAENVNLWDWESLGWDFHDPVWFPDGYLTCGAAPCLTGKGDNPLEWPEVLRVQQNVGEL